MWTCPVHGRLADWDILGVKLGEKPREFYCLTCLVERVIIPNSCRLVPPTQDPVVPLNPTSSSIGTIPVDKQVDQASGISSSFTISVSNG